MQKINILPVLVLSMFTQYSFSQKEDSTEKVFLFKGAVTVTNKGISLVPTFTLGKPAAIFDLSMGKKKLFFEPQLRFSLKGKPWSFLFWWRYKLKTDKKFSLTIGGHPALNFKTETHTINGVANNYIIARRYLAGDLVPNYFIAKNVSVGLYYLYSRGLDYGTTRNGHFLTINANFSHIKLGEQFFARFIPQIYYLNQDEKDGFYYTTSLTLVKRNFPVSFQSMTNKIIHTNIPGSEDFLLNFSLIYSFSKNYVQHK